MYSYPISINYETDLIDLFTGLLQVQPLQVRMILDTLSRFLELYSYDRAPFNIISKTLFWCGRV